MVQFKLLLLCSIIISFSTIPMTKTCIAQEGGVIYINADGSISPPTAPISMIDHITHVTYTLTADINDSIVIVKDNIIFDGGGHTIQGTLAPTSEGISLYQRRNVTVSYAVVRGFIGGIRLYSCFNCTAVGNIVTNNQDGIALHESYNSTVKGNTMTANNDGVNAIAPNFYYGSSNDTIIQNSIVNNSNGIYLYCCPNMNIIGNYIANNANGITIVESSNNKIYHNNFVNNTNQVYNEWSIRVDTWDDGYPSGGNYWSDYNGTDSDQDGIGDTPYIIYENSTDHYPLMNQYVIPEFPSFMFLPLLMIATLSIIVIFRRRHLTRAV